MNTLRGSMVEKEREGWCKRAAGDKRRLGLPLSSVRAFDDYLRAEWKIAPPASPDVWDEQLAEIAGAELFARFRYLHDKQASCISRGKQAPGETVRRFYDLIADERISGFVHSQKRAYILDAAALLVYLVTGLEVAGLVLDVGCHVGYHAILLGSETGREVQGIDLSAPAIEAARRKTPAGINVRFDTTPLDAEPFRERFEFVYAFDSVDPTPRNLASLSRVLKPNGVLMLADDFGSFADDRFREGVAAAGLGYGLADVTGGWIGEGRGFESTAVLVLIKGTARPLPQVLRRQVEEGWELFKDYANDPATPWDEKTQAYFRGKYVETHPAV
jgi:SAM-dependent methyltransferase